MITRKKTDTQTDNGQKPFIDVVLECKVLRLLVFDNEFDNKADIDEINSNLSYVTFLGLPKEIFTSDFKQWMFSKLLDNFVSFSECVSKSFLFDELKAKYKQAEEYEQKKVVLEKIFSYRFEAKSFKPMFDKLREKFFYRDLLNINLKINEQLKQDFIDEKHEAMALAQNIQDSVNKILLTTGKYKVLEEDVLHDISRDVAEIKERRENPSKYQGIPTGYKKIDQATGGWQPGEFSLVLGRPGMGKSILLLNFAYNAYKLNYNVIYVTIEMPMAQQRARFTSLITKISYNKIKLPHLMSDEEVELLERKLKKTKEEHDNFLWFIDAPQNCNSQFIDSRITAFENVTSKKAHLLIIDPIYLMTPSERKTDDPVGVISWDLKLLARGRELPIIAASQFNRESHKRHLHGKEVDSMDAAFSDKLGHNTDNMIGITGDKETACLYFPKTRDSQLTKLFFIKEFDIMRFKYDSRVDEGPSTIVEKDKEE
ncbi:MAG: DnaB-like helicase C-terminal domain-containing protein [Candidatus Nanoarchaeia archaeon]|jgi:replicative DNA helicase|nr:DnaB-like helicase C-terminal domain-containing protein [Candidatus Nanoarchaeia archaeon]